MRSVLITAVLGMLMVAAQAEELRADTLYLKNSGKIYGVVRTETSRFVEIEVCGGLVIFDRSEIERLDKGSAEEVKRFHELCVDEQERNRQRIAEHARLAALEPPQIPFRGERFAVVIDAVINEKADAALLLDTGAALVVLKRSVADQMGVDFSTLNSGLKLSLTDGRQVDAQYVMLDSVRIGDRTAYGVEAAIMMDDVAGPSFADGLLGMSFLNRFNFTIDYTTNSIVLEEHYQ